MGILDTIIANQDTIIPGASALLGWLGVDRWRKNQRAATLAEVDRWASSAAAAIALLVKHGVFTEHAAAVSTFMERFKKLATAAGVKIAPEHEARALLIAQEALTKAAQTAMEIEAARLGVAAEALIAKLDALGIGKKK